MAAPASSTRPGKLMMIGWPTPTVEPPFGTNEGGPNGAVPVNGVGFCPSAGPAATGEAPGKGNGGGASGAGGGGAGGAATPGSPGGGSGSASAGPAPSTSTKPNNPNIGASPAAFRAAKRPLQVQAFVQPDICIPPVVFWNSVA